MARYESAKKRRMCKDEQSPERENAICQYDAIQIEHSTEVQCQTDLTMNNLAELEHDCQQRLNEIHKYKKKPNTQSYPTQEDLKNDGKLLTFYTGLTSMTVFLAVFKFVSSVILHGANNKLTHFECFMLTLMKLRLNLSNYDLAFRFAVSESTVGRVFSKWIAAMDGRLSLLMKWPDRECLQKNMPFCFRHHYGLSVVSIIDCSELFIEKPSNLLAKSCTWSTYKHALQHS